MGILCIPLRYQWRPMEPGALAAYTAALSGGRLLLKDPKGGGVVWAWPAPADPPTPPYRDVLINGGGGEL